MGLEQWASKSHFPRGWGLERNVPRESRDGLPVAGRDAPRLGIPRHCLPPGDMKKPNQPVQPHLVATKTFKRPLGALPAGALWAGHGTSDLANSRRAGHGASALAGGSWARAFGSWLQQARQNRRRSGCAAHSTG